MPGLANRLPTKDYLDPKWQSFDSLHKKCWQVEFHVPSIIKVVVQQQCFM